MLYTDGWKFPDAKGKGKKNPMLKVYHFSPLPIRVRKLSLVGVYICSSFASLLIALLVINSALYCKNRKGEIRDAH